MHFGSIREKYFILFYFRIGNMIIEMAFSAGFYFLCAPFSSYPVSVWLNFSSNRIRSKFSPWCSLWQVMHSLPFISLDTWKPLFCVILDFKGLWQSRHFCSEILPLDHGKQYNCWYLQGKHELWLICRDWFEQLCESNQHTKPTLFRRMCV